MKLQKFITLGIASVLYLTVPAFSQEAGGMQDNDDFVADRALTIAEARGAHEHGGHEHGKPDFIQKLNITDDQLEKLAALRNQYEDKTSAKRAELHNLHRQIGEAMGQATVDKARVTSLHNRAQAIKNDLSNARLAYMLDRTDVFTADQRAQMHHWRLVREFGHGHHHHHGWMHHGNE